MNTPLIGWCGAISSAPQMQSAGLDYIEVQLVPMSLENDKKFVEAKAQVRDCPLPAKAFSYLFPHDFRFVGPQADHDRGKRYFERVAQLLEIAKADIVVYGSGWTRNVPDGYSRVQATDEFLNALMWCSEVLNGLPTTLVIEPLNRRESNLVNAVDEAVSIAKRLDRNNVRALADFYHLDEEAEPLDTLERNGDWVRHIHLADTDRLNPGSGYYDYDTFFSKLTAGRYDGMLSAECSVKGDAVEGMRQSVRFLRAKLEAAK